jgi:hypothetical protein
VIDRDCITMTMIGEPSRRSRAATKIAGGYDR